MTAELPTYPNRFQQMVAEFHRAFGHPDNIDKPLTSYDETRFNLRRKLIEEEGDIELNDAIEAGDDVATMDALLDCAVVTYGTLVEFGHKAREVDFVKGDILDPHNLTCTGKNHGLSGIVGDSPLANIIGAVLKSMTVFDGSHNPEAKDVIKNVLENPYQLEYLAGYCLSLVAKAGYDVDELFQEVHDSNMSKLGEDGKPIHSRGMELDGKPEGKILKGPNFREPNIRDIMVRQALEQRNSLTNKPGLYTITQITELDALSAENAVDQAIANGLINVEHRSNVDLVGIAVTDPQGNIFDIDFNIDGQFNLVPED